MKKSDEIAELKKQVAALTEQVAELKKAAEKEGLYNTSVIGYQDNQEQRNYLGAWDL